MEDPGRGRWRDVPARYGSWQSIYTRFRRWALDGTFTRMLGGVQADADGTGDIDWLVSVDSTIVRAHQHHKLDNGGQFAAWEQPRRFSEEVRAGFRSLR
ncbi:transposase [Micromonospora sp. NPDC005806]|uniref:transposase n=1 Tax=Micromonospora sp. NPDC005806 TaxID=3364234 RepID=UPI003698E270